jgi:hypothetical protein
LKANIWRQSDLKWCWSVARNRFIQTSVGKSGTTIFGF